MNRNVNINFRVSSLEKDMVENKAAKSKTSVSAFARKAVLGKDIIVIDGLREVMPELHAIGNNLNQQTVIMHQRGNYSPDLAVMKNSFCDVMDTINNKLRGGDADGNCKDSQSGNR